MGQGFLHQFLVDLPANLLCHSSTLHLEGEVLEEPVHTLLVVAVDQLVMLDQVLPQEPVYPHILLAPMLVLFVGQALPVCNHWLGNLEVHTEGLKPMRRTVSVDNPRHRQGIVQLGCDLDTKDFL